MRQNPVTTKSLFQYGLIAAPIAFAGFPLYILAPDFYATHRGLSLTLLGSLLLSLRLFDAMLDPVIGWLIDRLQGRFLNAIVSAAVLLCLSIFGLFNLTFITPSLWFGICTFFAVAAYSVLTIMLGALATLWTYSKDDQTRIAGMREALGLVGLITAVSLPTVLSRTVRPDHIYLWYASILTFLMTAGILVFWQFLYSLQETQEIKKKQLVSIMDGLQAVPSETKRLFVVYALSMLASSIPAILVLFYVRDLLGAEDWAGIFLFLYFLSGAAGMPLWKKLSFRFGKYKAWAFSNMLAVTGFVGAFFLKTGDVWPYAVICIISGLALGADLTLPPSILADHIHARRNTVFSGMHYSFLAFLAKASLAFASAAALPLLDANGFRPNTVNSADALLALSAAYALIPCILKLMSATLLYIFFIHPDRGGTYETVQNLHNHRSDFHA